MKIDREWQIAMFGFSKTALHHINVRLFLNNIFPGRWIVRRGSIELPARSPNLSPLDFFLWGHLKNKIYKEKPQNLQPGSQNPA
jgi:hypothetical protein